MDANRKIDYIESPTKDIRKTQKFFENVFGWSFQSYGPEYISYNDGRMSGGFYQSSHVASTERGSMLVVFYSDYLEETRDKITSCGGTLVKDIFAFPGGRRFHFTEPGGGEYAVWSDL
jgi:predicted enzyme related to lactoylglutathione lyase